MKILLDHNVDRRLRPHLVGHDTRTTREMRWEKLANGTLLGEAAVAGFDVVLSIDKKIRHEQNLDTLPLPVVVLDSVSNAVPELIPFVPRVLELFASPLGRFLYLVRRDGRIERLGTPAA